MRASDEKEAQKALKVLKEGKPFDGRASRKIKKINKRMSMQGLEEYTTKKKPQEQNNTTEAAMQGAQSPPRDDGVWNDGLRASGS